MLEKFKRSFLQKLKSLGEVVLTGCNLKSLSPRSPKIIESRTWKGSWANQILIGIKLALRRIEEKMLGTEKQDKDSILLSDKLCSDILIIKARVVTCNDRS